MRMRSLNLQVFRFRPDVEEEAVWESYTLECDEDASLLDALLQVQRQLDPSLSMRWSCRTGQCGACAMSVNGTAVLACTARIGDLDASLRVAPLANFPVIRDLVVELDGFLAGLLDLRPWSPSAPAHDARAMESASPVASALECVECALCHSVCPAVHRVPSFVGPAALSWAWLRNRHQNDAESADRRRMLSTGRGVWSCTECGACSRVCPYGVEPAEAASALKLDLVQWTLRRSGRPGGA